MRQAGPRLGSLPGPGNAADVAADFTVDVPATVLILGMGERGTGELVDYGWLETADSTSRWRMDYDRTLHAGGSVGNNVVGLGPSVVHLISDDIYIPIQFTQWTGGGGGGGFSYMRGTFDPSPVASSTWGSIKALYR